MNNKKLKQSKGNKKTLQTISKDFQENYYPSQISDSKHSTFYESFKKFSTHQKQSSLNQTSGKSSRASKLMISSEKMKVIKCGGSPKITNKHSSVLKSSNNCNNNNNKTAILEEDSYIQQISNSKFSQQQGSNGKNSYLGTASPLVKQNKKQSSKQLLQQNFDEYFKENNNSNNKMKKKNKSLGNLFDKKKQITTTTTPITTNVNPTKSGQDLSFEQMAQYFNSMGLSNRNSAINNSNNFSSINVKKIDLVSSKTPLCTDSNSFVTSRNKQNQQLQAQSQQQQQSQQSLNFKKSSQEEEGQEFSRYFQSKQQSVLKTDKKQLKNNKQIHLQNQQPYKKYQLLRKKCKKQTKQLLKENSSLKQQLSLQSEQLNQLQSQQSHTTKTNNILQLLLEFNSHINLNTPPPLNNYTQSSFILKPNDFHYFPDKILGRGGFGEVYYGKLHKTQDVAIKILKINVTEEQIHFLQGELIAMIVCDHPNLVKLHGVCLESTKSSPTALNLTVYIVMELLITDLRKLIFKQNKIHLSRLQKYRILLEILKGLFTLHSTNYVHCDLKMQNVLLDSKLSAKISDFGLSKSLGQGITKQTVTGGFSERNSAFEYLVEDKVSTKGDIWSFGILMYELLMEKIAWGGLTGPQTVAKVSIQTPFYSCNQKIGDETDSIIENCLNYDHSKRPSAEVLIQQITQLMEKL